MKNITYFPFFYSIKKWFVLYFIQYKRTFLRNVPRGRPHGCGLGGAHVRALGPNRTGAIACYSQAIAKGGAHQGPLVRFAHKFDVLRRRGNE